MAFVLAREVVSRAMVTAGAAMGLDTGVGVAVTGVGRLHAAMNAIPANAAIFIQAPR
jgi:hypothetical protein